MSRTISSSASFSLKIRTALSGSPTYFGSAKRTVFTRPSPWMSKHGVMRGLSISHRREVLQQLRAEVVALLRMELDAVYMAAADCRREVGPVVGRRGDVLRTIAFEEERMQKVETRVVLESGEKTVARPGGHVVPSHVRNRKLRRRVPRPEAAHEPVDPSEAA